MHGMRMQGAPASRGRARALALIGVLARGVLAIGVLALAGCDGGDGQAGAGAAPPPPEVTVATPLVQKLVEWNEFTGRFEAVEHVEVRARVCGYLATIDFEDGQLVERGPNLFVIDPRPFEIALERARRRSRAAPRRSSSSPSCELQRAPSWSAARPSPRPPTTSGCRSARAPRRASGAAQAAVQQAELNLEFTQHQRADRRPDLRPPGRHRQSGDRHDSLLTTIVSLDPIYFVFDMSEADFLGLPARACRRASCNRRASAERWSMSGSSTRTTGRAQGQMNFVDNQVDRAAGTIRARAVFPNPDLLPHAGPVRPHPAARARAEYEAILIPDEAIVTDQSQQDRHDGERRRHGRAEGDPARPASSWACASSARASTPTTASSSTAWCAPAPACKVTPAAGQDRAPAAGRD